MNHAETYDLLTFIAAYDNRRFDDATVLAWHPIFADLPFADCRAAVTAHFASSEQYLMPVHVVKLAEQVARERRRRSREAREAELAAIESADPTRHDRSDAVKALIAELRDRLPEGDPDSLRHGSKHWREVREARERQERAEPNPHYDPEVAAQLAIGESQPL